ncbi:hypothetical protein D6764_01285 [Candidatus Woesearchaeota archaeon]|nr:MAG: hypothetical protein D6764_01285 [Candidatus Woesearchaeota archaeon]
MNTLDKLLLKAHEAINGRIERDKDGWPLWLRDESILFNGTVFHGLGKGNLKYRIVPSDSEGVNLEVLRESYMPMRKSYAYEPLEGIDARADLVNYKDLLKRQISSLAARLAPLKRDTGFSVPEYLMENRSAFVRALDDARQIHEKFPVSILLERYAGDSARELPKNVRTAIDETGLLIQEYFKSGKNALPSLDPVTILNYLENVSRKMTEMDETKLRLLGRDAPFGERYSAVQKVDFKPDNAYEHKPTLLQTWWEALSNAYGMSPDSITGYEANTLSAGEHLLTELMINPENRGSEQHHASYKLLRNRNEVAIEEARIVTPLVYLHVISDSDNIRVRMRRGYVRDLYFNAAANIIGPEGLGLVNEFKIVDEDAVEARAEPGKLHQIMKALYWTPRSMSDMRLANPALYERLGKNITTRRPQIK